MIEFIDGKMFSYLRQFYLLDAKESNFPNVVYTSIYNE